jgi:glycosyltransferase involved in cell wall biosynthesis
MSDSRAERRRLLLISYAFPPLVNAQAIRWLMLVRQLVARGHSVDVLTVRLPSAYHDLLDEIPQTVRLHRVPLGPLERVAFGATAQLDTESDWIASRRQAGTIGAVRRVYGLARRFADAAMITDLCTEWLPFAAPKALRLARERRFDAIVSSFEPGVSHFVGWIVKRRTGLPWLGDFGDPWVNQNTPTWRRGLDLAVERRLVRNFDAVTVTTEQLAAALRTQGALRAPVYVVPQAFDPDLFAAVPPEPLRDSGRLHLVYTGTLFPEVRSPLAVFAALELLRETGTNVALTIAGRVPMSFVEQAHRSLNGVVRFMGIVPHKRALALQKGADVLLHLDNRGADVQVPGKLYEYLGAGRPLLVVRHGRDSAAARCVREGGCGRDVPDEPRAIAAALESFNAERHSRPQWQPSPEFAARHTYGRSADVLCTAIEQAIRKPSVSGRSVALSEA